ncbi:hypothetical protein [Agromyces seonyuensis]|uniref:Uncharacterized protein n=1 Tax=Agromyces seonyuensis TaxID=2662446 RepID=A0A6I4P209_9MICO|nr:hypothetical protein [Agromyces seonyuensis]MWB99612.1 hypothetical protein [Agromyces seonyuensis]
MLDALHFAAVLPAGIGLGCAVLDRRSRARAVLPAALGLAAMLDMALGWMLLPPILWAALLVATGILLAVGLRRSAGADEAHRSAGPASHERSMRAHRAIGMLVSAVLVVAMIPAGAAAASIGVHGGHDPALAPLALAAAAGYLGWSLHLAARGRADRGRRAALARLEVGAMAAMTAVCAAMPVLA